MTVACFCGALVVGDVVPVCPKCGRSVPGIFPKPKEHQ